MRTKSEHRRAYERLQRRKKRVRAKISGTKTRPRLSIFLSHRHLYAQFINDAAGTTLFGLGDMNNKQARTSVDAAYKLGETAAKEAIKRGIYTVVFDKGHHAYHGRIKAFADGARAGGLRF